MFILGPSHHVYLRSCCSAHTLHYTVSLNRKFYLQRSAVADTMLPLCSATACEVYETPLGPLAVDVETLAALGATGHFKAMSKKVDEAEHSLELHLRAWLPAACYVE